MRSTDQKIDIRNGKKKHVYSDGRSFNVYKIYHTLNEWIHLICYEPSNINRHAQIHTGLSRRSTMYEGLEDQFLETVSLATLTQDALIVLRCIRVLKRIRAKKPGHLQTGLYHRFSTYEIAEDQFLKPNSLTTPAQDSSFLDVWGSRRSVL